MKQELIFDNETHYKDKKLDTSNEVTFKRFPAVLRYFIQSQHNMIYQKVKTSVNKRFGEEGLKSLVKTSGFRSDLVNRTVGGVPSSLHLYGCAIDFKKVGIFKNQPIPVCESLEVIDSGKCWHIQIKRFS